MYNLHQIILRLSVLNSSPITVGLGAYFSEAGPHTINLDSLQNFGIANQIYLEDRALNVFTNLKTNPSYNFSVASADSLKQRFFLHFSNQGIGLSEKVALAAHQAYQQGEFLVLESAFEAAQKTITMFSLSGMPVARWQQNTVLAKHVISHLPKGLYILEIETKGQATERIKIYLR
jgi:hypothetical protein